jgi:hypothetical protein
MYEKHATPKGNQEHDPHAAMMGRISSPLMSAEQIGQGLSPNPAQQHRVRESASDPSEVIVLNGQNARIVIVNQPF